MRAPSFMVVAYGAVALAGLVLWLHPTPPVSTEPAPGVPDVPADGAGVPDVKTPEHTGGLASTGR